MALSEDEIRRSLSDLGSDLIERKESVAAKDKICEAICAFANDLPNYRRPGLIVVGVTDDGRPNGYPVTDELLQTLGAIRSDGNILPPPSITVRKVRIADAEVATVEVQPSPAPPVRYRGRVWIRVGPRRAVATADEERQLSEKRRSADLPFDAQPVLGATLDDLDLDLFRREYLPAALPADVLAENGRTLQEQLTALRLLSPGSDSVPTAAGLLVLGKDPTEFLPGAYVQFLRLEGTDLAAPIKDHKRLDGSLIDVLRQLDEVLMLNVTTPTTVAGPSKEDSEPDYPLVALQQVARNALMHRSYDHTNTPTRITWYSDRVEIISPGGPYGPVNQENFGWPGVTAYRNPTLAEAMRALGYVQRFGIGLELVRSTMSSNHNPPAEFQTIPGFVGVTLRGRS